jgi:hypothetical protein
MEMGPEGLMRMRYKSRYLTNRRGSEDIDRATL